MAYNLWRALAAKQLVAPYVMASITKNSWPKKMNLEDPYFHDSQVDDFMHPSTHALMGEQALYESLHPERRKLLPPEVRDFTRLFTPMMGSMVHTIVQQKLIHDGLVGPKDVEMALLDEEHHWRGHADLLFQDMLVDIKTTNSRSFAYLNGVPKKSWIYQLQCYMDAMEKDYCIVLVIEMGMPWAMTEIRINKNDEILDEIYSKWARVRLAIANNEPPTTCCKKEDSRYCPLQCGGKFEDRT